MSINFRSTPETMRLAMVFMIGQMDVMGLHVSTSDIAAFCDCTKITARKHLNILVKDKKIRKVEVPYRKYATRHVWQLTDRSKQELGLFLVYRNAYNMVVAEKMAQHGY